MSALTSVWHRWLPDADDASVQCYARAFGTAASDIDIDLDAARPQAVSALIAACVRRGRDAPLTEDACWRWHIAERLQALLAIIYAGGVAALPARAHCPQPACRQDIELELPLANFALAASARTEIHADGARLTLRLPNGEDQRRWLLESSAAAASDERRYARDVLVAINDAPPAPDWQPSTAVVDAIGDALDALDPLTALSLPVSCPYCEARIAVDIDLEALALARLRQTQRALLDDVHRLAHAYAWAETDILNLPAWRRAFYRARVEAQSP